MSKYYTTSFITLQLSLIEIVAFTGNPESSAAGSGVSGSGGVGIDYCCVPATASFAFGVNLTF